MRGRKPESRHSTQLSQTAEMTEGCQGVANNIGAVLHRGYPESRTWRLAKCDRTTERAVNLRGQRVILELL